MQQQYSFQLTILLLTLFVASPAGALPSSTNKRRPMIPRQHDDAQERAVSSSYHHHADAQSKEISFIPVVYLSIFNCVVNILRPDPAIIWQVRFVVQSQYKDMLLCSLMFGQKLCNSNRCIKNRHVYHELSGNCA